MAAKINKKRDKLNNIIKPFSFKVMGYDAHLGDELIWTLS